MDKYRGPGPETTTYVMTIMDNIIAKKLKSDIEERYLI